MSHGFIAIGWMGDLKPAFHGSYSGEIAIFLAIAELNVMNIPRELKPNDTGRSIENHDTAVSTIQRFFSLFKRDKKNNREHLGSPVVKFGKYDRKIKI
jgi:hypothetical protein